MVTRTELEQNRQYVTIEHSPNKDVLLTPAEHVTFPLSQEDANIIEEMRPHFENDNMAGLAAPQIGYNRKIILYRVTEEVLKLRENVVRTVPLTVFINASYQAIKEKGTNNDWEGCFSVAETLGKVDRFNEVKITAHTVEGKEVEFIAKGFEARLLQHEIDHTNGTLFIHRLKPDDVQGPYDEMMEFRTKEIEQMRTFLDAD